MAREVTVRISDDLDRDQDATVVREVGFDGWIYVLDLTDKHDKELHTALDKWLKAAHRKVRWPKRQLRELLKETEPQTVPTSPENAPPVEEKSDRTIRREWARANGFTVSSRGNLSKEVNDAFDAAHDGGKKRA